MTDLIFGCFEKYSFDELSSWYNSMIFHKYEGDIVLIIYGDKQNVDQKIFDLEKIDKKVILVHKEKITKAVVVDRFKDMSEYLNNSNKEYRYVFSTDPSDVIFQENPSKLASRFLKSKQLIVACSESVLYKDETWGNINLKQSFPDFYNSIKEKEVYNAGTIFGTPALISSLFSDIFSLSLQSKVNNPDQAAFNILLQTKYLKNTRFTNMNDGVSVQCGTTAWPLRVSEYGHLLLEIPIFFRGIAYNSKGIKLGIVHQYNKVPFFHTQIMSRYYYRFQLSRKNKL